MTTNIYDVLRESHEIQRGLFRRLLRSKAWIGMAKTLSAAVHHHLREEEKKFFQVSGKLLTATRKLQLTGQYRRDYQRMHRLLAAEATGR